MKHKKIIGFAQLRNESERGNLENWFRCMAPCDYIYIWDHASTDNSREIYEKHSNATVIYSDTNRFNEELICKDILYKKLLKDHPDVDWVLWLDGDLILDGRLLVDNNLQKLCNKLDDENVDLPRFGHYNLWRSDTFYRLDQGYHNLHGHWFPLWGKAYNKYFVPRTGLHFGQVPEGTTRSALVDVSVIHRGFAKDEFIIEKYLNYKSLGQSGWDLNRLIDEETLACEKLDNKILPSWYNIDDNTSPVLKDKLIDIYNNIP